MSSAIDKCMLRVSLLFRRNANAQARYLDFGIRPGSPVWAFGCCFWGYTMRVVALNWVYQAFMLLAYAI